MFREEATHHPYLVFIWVLYPDRIRIWNLVFVEGVVPEPQRNTLVGR